MDLVVENLRIAWQSLRSNPLRTLLTALSVSLGAGAISLMVSLSKSGVATMTAGMDAVGGRKIIFLVPRQPKDAKVKSYDRGITSEDAAAIRQRVPGLEDVAFLTKQGRHIITGRGKKSEVDVAVGSSFRRFTNMPIAFGRDIPPDGDDDQARVAVLTQKAAVELFGSAEEAVGETIVLWGHRYKLIGVTTQASTMGFRMGGIDKERTLFVSSPVMIKDEGVIDSGWMILSADGTHSHEHIMSVANAIMMERHAQTDDFEFIDFARMMSKFDKIFVGLRLLTGMIAAISLLIAGAGIMNVLLASIKQRVTEIGMRRAIGASQRDIRSQFLTEAVALAGLGGFIGSAAGVLGALLAGLVADKVVPGWQTRVAWEAAVIAVVVATLSGLVFGLAPSRRAARLEVVSCLRGET
jgi:putative ABC transport system permease protein